MIHGPATLTLVTRYPSNGLQAGPDVVSGIEAYVRAAIHAQNAEIERACEEAVQDGEHGVLWDGKTAHVDSTVPYGYIYDVSRVAE